VEGRRKKFETYQLWDTKKFKGAAESAAPLLLAPKGDDSRIKNAITKYDNNQVALNP
jgi:hypothetical protein